MSSAALLLSAADDLWSHLVRVSVLLLVGGIVGWLSRRADPAVRHGIWAASLTGTLLTGGAAWVATLAGLRFDAGAAMLIPPARGHPAEAALLWIWAAGTVVALARLSGRVVAARRLAAGGLEPDASVWQTDGRAAARELGLRGDVPIRESERIEVPLTVGIRRPVVLVPRGSEQWPSARRRAVLLHELTHVRRRDCATELLVQSICALYWFHPGVWWVARQLRLAREQACDMAVLGAGTPAAEYAGHLVALLRAAVGGRRVVATGVGRGGRSVLERRMLSMSSGAAPSASGVRVRLSGLAPIVLALLLGLWAPARAVDQGRQTASAAGHTKARCDCLRKQHLALRR